MNNVDYRLIAIVGIKRANLRISKDLIDDVIGRIWEYDQGLDVNIGREKRINMLKMNAWGSAINAIFGNSVKRRRGEDRLDQEFFYEHFSSGRLPPEYYSEAQRVADASPLLKRYLNGESQTDMAKALGYSLGRISQLLKLECERNGIDYDFRVGNKQK